MSWPVTTYTCTRCDFKQGDGRTWGEKEYVLENGVRIPLDWMLGWCRDCEGLAAVESLSPENAQMELAEALESLAGGAHPFRRWWQLHLFLLPGLWRRNARIWAERAGRVEDAKDALHLIAWRQTPPRCLACGSSRVIAPLVTDRSAGSGSNEPRGTGFFHPGCGGEILMFMDHDFRIALRPSVRRYTPEGDFIEKKHVKGYDFPRSGYYDLRTAENARIRGTGTPRTGRFSLA